MTKKTASSAAAQTSLSASDLHADHSFTPGARRSREDTVDESLQVVRSVHQIKAHPGLDRVRLVSAWKGYTMELSSAAADAVEFYPQLFPNLPFTASNLRNLREEVRELQSTKGKVLALLDHVGDHLLHRKSQLHRCTTLIWQTLQAQLINPLLTPKERQRLEAAAANMQSIIDASNIAVLASRRETERHRAEVRTKLAEIEAKGRLSSMDKGAAAENPHRTEILHKVQPAAARGSRRRAGRRTRR